MAHVSDVHFGAHEPELVDGVLAALRGLAPDLVVVSGDLTQRARRRQFLAARRFLDALPAPHLVVPGNHDMPLFDLVRRLLFPRARYRRFVTADLEPLVTLPGVRVLGLDSSRRRTTGILTPKRLRALQLLGEGEPGDLRVLVTHHPLVARQMQGHLGALEAAALARVDLALAGHAHLSWRRRIAEDPGLGILLVQAGTATSYRRRAKEPSNSFNVLRWDGETLLVELWTWDGTAFAPGHPRRFARRADGWHPE